jgi:hypothetical protein
VHHVLEASSRKTEEKKIKLMACNDMARSSGRAGLDAKCECTFA